MGFPPFWAKHCLRLARAWEGDLTGKADSHASQTKCYVQQENGRWKVWVATRVAGRVGWSLNTQHPNSVMEYCRSGLLKGWCS